MQKVCGLVGQDCQCRRRAELVGIQCPVGCREHKGMWCCEAPQHQGSSVPAPCHFSCSACWYQASMSPHPPFSWGNEWVWRFQGIPSPRLSQVLQGTAQVFGPPREGQRIGRYPTTTSQQPHSKAQDINRIKACLCLLGVVAVESLDLTVSRVASSPSAQPWASPHTSDLAMALSNPKNNKS